MKFIHLLCIFVFFMYSQISHAGRYLPIFLTDLELVERIKKYDDKQFIDYRLISGSNYSFDERYVSPDIPFSVGLRLFLLDIPCHQASNLMINAQENFHIFMTKILMNI